MYQITGSTWRSCAIKNMSDSSITDRDHLLPKSQSSITLLGDRGKPYMGIGFNTLVGLANMKIIVTHASSG